MNTTLINRKILNLWLHYILLSYSPCLVVTWLLFVNNAGYYGNLYSSIIGSVKKKYDNFFHNWLWTKQSCPRDIRSIAWYVYINARLEIIIAFAVTLTRICCYRKTVKLSPLINGNSVNMWIEEVLWTLFAVKPSVFSFLKVLLKFMQE